MPTHKTWSSEVDASKKAFGFFKAVEDNDRWVEVVTQGSVRTKMRTHLFSLQRLDTLGVAGKVSASRLQLILLSWRFTYKLKPYLSQS